MANLIIFAPEFAVAFGFLLVYLGEDDEYTLNW